MAKFVVKLKNVTKRISPAFHGAFAVHQTEQKFHLIRLLKGFGALLKLPRPDLEVDAVQ